jgi:hypothetical protein
MTPDNVRQALNTIQARMHNILDATAKGVLEDARAQLSVAVQDPQDTKKKKKKKTAMRWRLTISREHPLRFKRSLVDGRLVQADLSCVISWDDGLKSQDLLLRLWSFDEGICFREDLDAPLIRTRLPTPPARVIARYHFDKANPGQDGPIYHLQYGGNATDAELFWHPEPFKWPRILHHPMDLVLACEMVAANLFASEYRKIAKDPSWVAAVRESQAWLVDGYYKTCATALSSGKSLVEALWNH